MDFIVGLPQAQGSNAICTIIDRLSKERHYVPCTATDKGTSTEATAEILIGWVFRIHSLLSSIILDRGPQFMSAVWKSFCTRLGISSNLSIAYHPEIDGQTERANQDVARFLRTFYSYNQDKWLSLLLIAEFADNNTVLSTIKITSFFANKGFHPRISFSPNTTKYKIIRERLLAARAVTV